MGNGLNPRRVRFPGSGPSKFPHLLKRNKTWDTSVDDLGTYSHTGSKLNSDALGSVRRTELAAIKQEITKHRAHSAMLA